MTVVAAVLAIALASRVELRRGASPEAIAGGFAVDSRAGLGLLGVFLGLRRRPAHAAASVDPLAPVEVAQLVAIGVAAGLSVVQSLAFCAERGPPELRRELIGLLRRAGFDGLERAAADHQGRLAGVLAIISTALRSGAPVELLLRTHATEARGQLAGERISRARKLPGILAVPLALLLLPGFVLMVMGPAVLEIAARMLAPLSRS